MKTIPKATLIALLGIAAIAAVAQSVQAQAALLDLEADAITTPIQPDGTGATFKVKAKYTLTVTPLIASGSVFSTANVRITFTGCPSGVTVSGPGSIQVPIGPTSSTNTASGTYEGEATYAMTATRDVPGLKGQRCDINGNVDAIGNQAAVPAAEAKITQQFLVGYFPLVQAKVDTKIAEAGPQKSIPYNIQLENKGNAQTQITFSLGTPEPEGSKWNPILPEVLILDSTGDPGGKLSDTAQFSVATPFKNGWNNEEKSFQVVMLPTAATDASKAGNVITANVLARVRGIYVPALEPVLLIGALGLLAVALRNRDDA